MTSADLLHLDRRRCFPHRLRYEWQALYNQDPLRVAGEWERASGQFVLGTSLLLLTIIPIVSGITKDPSILGVLMGAAIPLLLCLMSATLRLIYYREGGKAFAMAISKLGEFLEISVESLGDYSFNELTEHAKEKLIGIATTIIKNETEGRIDAALQEREWFKTVRQQFVSFDLVGGKWDPFFEKARARAGDKLTKSPPPGPNGGQPNAGIFDLIREGDDVPDLTPNVTSEIA